MQIFTITAFINRIYVWHLGYLLFFSLLFVFLIKVLNFDIFRRTCHYFSIFFIFWCIHIIPLHILSISSQSESDMFWIKKKIQIMDWHWNLEGLITKNINKSPENANKNFSMKCKYTMEQGDNGEEEERKTMFTNDTKTVQIKEET